MTDKARPATCSAIAALDPTLGQDGCKRLPRHKGEHRGTLHQVRVTTSATNSRATKGRRVSKAGLKRLATKLAVAVEAGEVKPSVAMARYAAYVTRLAAKRARRVTVAGEAPGSTVVID